MISREGAIKRLKEARFTVQPYLYMNEAFDVAIEALSQPERPKGRWVPVHEHMWRKFEGSIDEFAFESGYHNGPVCELCGEHICIHCNPDWKKDECAAESYKCSECNHHVKEKTEFCPNCGSDNRGDEE